MIRNRCDSKRMAIKYKQAEATGKQKKRKNGLERLINK